ncbi:MAG: methyltransferase domain-containing protein [Candidatus Altiarchaeota archaeon]
MDKAEIFKLFEGKSVLQLGVLGDYKSYVEGGIGDWEFARITKASRKAVGVDINREGVNVIRGKGFENVIYGNAEELDLGETFDVIYAGDIIEHLDNVGGFLESCKRHMHGESVLVITTPNPYSIDMILKAFTGVDGKIYGEHTALFHRKNIGELLRRHGLELRKTGFYTQVYGKSFLTKVKSRIILLLSALKPDWNQSYCFEVVLAGKDN